MHPAVEQIRQYLQLIALQFVQHPEQAELRVAESPQGDAVRFRLILEKTDVARIIGRNGMTASRHPLPGEGGRGKARHQGHRAHAFP